MYNDFRHVTREDWKYAYKGSEMLEFARKRHDDYLSRETSARQEMSKLLQDMRVSTSDDRVKKLEKDIETCANLREQCAVFVHEFSRTPDREFSLALGDVVFFGILEGAKDL
jgi:hypothetical protein